MNRAPCKDCSRRAPNCHSKCEAYKNYKSSMDKLHIIMQKHNLYAAASYDAIERNHKPKIFKKEVY